MRHPFPGPGLSIRILCADEPWMDKDFSETQVLVKIIVEYNQMLQRVIFIIIFYFFLINFFSIANLFLQRHALLNRVESVTNDAEREILRKVSTKQQLAATLLPIRSVGVQVKKRKLLESHGLNFDLMFRKNI